MIHPKQTARKSTGGIDPSKSVTSKMEEETTLFFFGEHYMSNWHPSIFALNFDMGGIKRFTFENVEQAMMASKAALFGDKDSFDKILKTPNPKSVKRLGRKVSNFNPEVWDKYKKHIVKTAVTAKFIFNPELKQQLLSTGNRYLAEDSPYDKVWGIGTKSVKHKANKTWPGENLLGVIMMEVRDELRE